MEGDKPCGISLLFDWTSSVVWVFACLDSQVKYKNELRRCDLNMNFYFDTRTLFKCKAFTKNASTHFEVYSIIASVNSSTCISVSWEMK